MRNVDRCIQPRDFDGAPVQLHTGRLDNLVMILGDTHFPFEHLGAVAQAVDLIREYQPDYVVQVGDLYDMLSFSKYPRSYNIYTPSDELSLARTKAVAMWSAVRAAAPAAKCIQFRGNHDDRPLKRVLGILPAAEQFVEDGMNGMFRFEGVESLSGELDSYEIDGVLYQHGYAPFGRHAPENNQSTVTGHLHRGGTVFLISKPYGIFWELNAGWLGDARAPVYAYSAQKRLHATTLGIGIVDPLGPRFLPF